MATDYKALCRALNRDEFTRRYPHGFLVTMGPMWRPQGPRTTGSVPIVNLGDSEATRAGITPGDDDLEADTEVKILAVEKVRPTFPDMITIGRTDNNDLVIKDVSVSKFHAFLSVDDGSVAATDAGSRNGTRVDGKPLEPRAEPTPLSSGSTLRVGNLDLRYYDAGAFWDSFNDAG